MKYTATLSAVQVGQAVKSLLLLGERKITIEETEKDRFVVTTTTETALSKKSTNSISRKGVKNNGYSGSIPEPSLFMTRIGATLSETSCLISNLFTEIRPVCGHCEGDSVVLCGVTYEGQEETVVLRDYGFDYSGNPETVENIRKRRCIYGNKKKLPADFK